MLTTPKLYAITYITKQKGNKMTIKELKNKIKDLPNNQEIIFYNLENHNLTEYNLESIINVDGRLEVTTTKENLDD